MARIDIKEYARRGAMARVAELQTELAGIYSTFPELRRTDVAGDAETAPRRARGRRKPMTAAQRRAVSQRMRKYWAARRKAKT